jgi:hypothetical protein
MTEVVLEFITLILERVKGFVFNFPARAASSQMRSIGLSNAWDF